MPITSRFNENGVDVTQEFITKEYLLEAYPELVPWQKSPGLFVWGLNTAGQLGDNTITAKSSPIQTISTGTNWKRISDSSSASSHTAAIKTDGTLWLWGNNSFGQLGDNTTVLKSSPVQTVSAGTNWKQVGSGSSFTGAIKNDGSLWTWGQNSNGQLGDNSIIEKSSPVQTVSGGTNWEKISSGSSHIAAIKTDGTLWLWGNNSQGQLGDNTVTNRSSPVQTVSGGTNWKQVSAGSGFTGAIKTDGTLWMWGSGSSGQLGNNNTVFNVEKSSPVQTVSGGTNWKKISVGGSHTAAIKTDGTLWMWGSNTNGRLGDNTVTNRSSPVQTVSGGTNWMQVSAGAAHTAVIKTDGTLWTWGNNGNGRLGDDTVVSRSSPVQTVSGGTNWKQVSIGSSSTLAIYDFDDI